MRALFFALLFFTSLRISVAGDQSELLVGRWRAETVPTGYWIIDRYGDGRFAQKRYLSYHLNEPSEIVVVWGRWHLKNNKYWEVLDGSNSEFLNRFLSEWKATKVLSISPERFVFESQEGYPRFEVPFDSRKKLLSIPVERPKDVDFPSSLSSKSVVKRPLKNIPAWVNSRSQPETKATP